MGKSNSTRKAKRLIEDVRRIQKQLSQIRKELEEFTRESSPEDIISNTSTGINNNFKEFIAKHILKQHPKFKLIIIKKKKQD